MLSSSDIGKAGEHRVVSELLLRGYRPLLAIVDDGVDITLSNGVTLQVKACSAATRKSGNPYYVFTTHTLHEKRDATGRRKKKQKMVADFAVLWCIGIDAFYIIPRAAIGGRHTINIPVNDGSHCMWNEYHDRWDLLEVIR